MNLLQLHSLKKYYATQKAVDDISFNIPQGSILGLLGPNGAGKTTLLRMITGIFLPDSGEILFDEKPFKAIDDSIHIGYMPEERGLYKKMKVGEHAIYLAQLKGLSKHEALQKAKQWFEKLEMQSWWNKKVEDLSKGMAQKLQFVTTVMHEPKLIILDEPFSGLDPVNANIIKEEIFTLSQKGSTIIFSTHRMEQVEEICDKIVLVNKGKKILDGCTQDIKQTFKEHKFHIQLATAVDDNIIHPSFNIIQHNGNSLILHINESYNGNDVLQYFIHQNITIQAFHEILPSLNEIFIKLTSTKFTADSEDKKLQVAG